MTATGVPGWTPAAAEQGGAGTGQSPLLPQHQALIDGSAIAPEVARARGYRSVTTTGELAALGFAPDQCQPAQVPGLLVPIYNVDGRLALHQYRPDTPRADPKKPEKSIKYETPAGKHLVLDVPRHVLPHLGNPRVPLVVTEGARKADGAVSARLPCIALLGVTGWRGTNPQGGKTALPDWADVALNGRMVDIIFDSDAMQKPEVHAALGDFTAFLGRKGARWRIVYLPDHLPGRAPEVDASGKPKKVGLDDFLAAGGTPDALLALSEPRLRPLPQQGLAAGGARGGATGADTPPWPAPLEPAAYYGLAGEVVRFYEEESEADPPGILVHFLVEFAAAVGPGPAFPVGATRHPALEYALVVGRSARGRKGDGAQPARRLFEKALGTDWLRTNRTTGLSTGEGLIHEVRDAQGDADAEDVTAAGIADKRRIVVEPEFARVLQTQHREGNTLSAVLRDAWDGASPLKVMTKTRPTTATGAHVAVVAHTTVGELRRLMTATDAANGYLNRFLCVAVTRAKLKPSPKPPDAKQEMGLADTLKKAVAAARKVTTMRRSDAAKKRWETEYARLAAERDGLAGDVLARAEAHVLRLSMLYALLDGSAVIELAHLEAALEIWRYVEESTIHVYGGATGDEVADRILEAVREAAAADGIMTRTQISDRFDRHVPKQRIDIALTTLEATGRLRRLPALPTGGRPAECWTVPDETPCERSERSEKSPPDRLLSLFSLSSHPPTQSGTPPDAAPESAAADTSGGSPVAPERAHDLAPDASAAAPLRSPGVGGVEVVETVVEAPAPDGTGGWIDYRRRRP